MNVECSANSRPFGKPSMSLKTKDSERGSLNRLRAHSFYGVQLCKYLMVPGDLSIDFEERTGLIPISGYQAPVVRNEVRNYALAPRRFLNPPAPRPTKEISPAPNRSTAVGNGTAVRWAIVP